ncbi:MAG: hypothetical protein ACJAZV_000316 [Roseivirga sp.]|jgi:hypothetical protein
MKFNRLSIIVLTVLLAFGCADEDLKPILTFEDAGKGAYIRRLSESAKLVNVLNESTINASSYTYSVEFVDLQKGKLVAEYRLDLIYRPVNGANVTVSGFRSYGQSDFTDSEKGFRSMSNISITAPQILQALNRSPGDLVPGDQFTFKGYLTLEDGSVFGFDNSSSAVRGSAFIALFDFTLPAACPSDLAGTFAYESTAFWCGGTGTGNVNIVARGGGVYRFSDWSFGGYAECYGGGTANSTTLTFTDVCTDVSFSGFTDSFGDIWTFTSTIVGNDWTIDWSNTYGETGTAIIRYTGGADWPITLN